MTTPSTWSDEHLGGLIADAFTAHEPDADPDVARRIALAAPPTPRRTGPVVAVAAAVVVLLAAIASQTLRSDDVAEPAGPPHPTPSVMGDNRTVAAAEAERLLADALLPPGSRPRPGPLAPALRRLPVHAVPLDPSLTRTEWRVVPEPLGDVVRFYRDQESSGTSEGHYTWWSRPGTPAYASPTVIVSYAALTATTTAIRVDVTLAARDDRTAATYVPEDVTSIDISMSPVSGPGRPPTEQTVTDPARTGPIVAAYNDLLGASARSEGMACGSPVGILRAYTVTFHWPGHTLVVDPGSPLCGEGRGLTLDGTELAPRLEGDDAFDALLQAAL